MTAITLTAISFCSVLMFPLMAQPLSLGLNIMLATLFLCALSSMLISSWYAYILFLIYVGGLLVMFAYVASLTPNILFSNFNSLFLLILLLIPSFYVFYSYISLDLPTLGSLNQWMELNKLKKQGIQLTSSSQISILIALGIILLLNLIVVVKICYYQHASLRPYKKNTM
uniref:NADH-ubiquinone oxidoreductase chain 6 n=1 Tax=Bithynia leachii TaxID=2722873 RepID=A0A7D7JRM4_9CAEN|nr:NADH dehydrogenase subunit 6 [Bithynia leachii]